MLARSILLVAICIFTFSDSRVLAFGPFCSDVFSFEKDYNSRKETHTSDTFKVVDATNENLYFKAYLNSKGVLYIEALLNIPEFGIRSKLHGKQLYREMITHFGIENIQSIRGIWVEGLNYDHFFKKYSEGYSKEESALSTWSGNQAQSFGFSVVKAVDLIPIPYTNRVTVNVTYEKPTINRKEVDEVWDKLFKKNKNPQ